MATDFETVFGGNPSDLLADQFGENMTHTDVSAGTTSSVNTIAGPSEPDGNVSRKTFRWKTADSTMAVGDTITDPESNAWIIDEIAQTDNTVWTVAECVLPGVGVT